MKKSKLAILGGEKLIKSKNKELFRWPIINTQDEQSILDLLRKPNFADSRTVTLLEKEISDWLGVKYSLSCNSGTSALETAMFACGVKSGTEVIVPSLTHWASVLPAAKLGATVVFADVDSSTLNIDPKSIQPLINKSTRAIIVVHQHGRPCEMDSIMSIVKSKSISVIEDASQAFGSRYKNRKVGTLGNIAAFSINGKAISSGEGGMLVTNDHQLFERAVSWGHDHRFNKRNVKNSVLNYYEGLPLGCTTSRMHNLTASMARGQLKHLKKRMEIIDASMSLFWSKLKGIDGFSPHTHNLENDSSMGCWYRPLGFYDSESLGNLMLKLFVKAIRAEGVMCEDFSDFRFPLHLHPRINKLENDNAIGIPLIQSRGGENLPNTENVKAVIIPRFTEFSPSLISLYADAFAKVINGKNDLLKIKDNFISL